MDYNLKMIINDLEVLEMPEVVEVDSETTVNTPFVTDVKLASNTSLSALGIGTVASDCLTFKLLNPATTSLDGATVDCYISMQGETPSDLLDIEDESTGTEYTAIDESDASAVYEDDEEGDPASESDIADAEQSADALTESTYDFYNGEELPVETETTDEAEEEEWHLIGRYFVTHQTLNSDGSMLITAYDGVSLLTDKYQPSLTTGTLQQFYDDLTTQIVSNYGILCDPEEFTQEQNITIQWKYSTTFRDAFGLLAGLVGGYGVIGSDLTLGIDYCTYGDIILLDSDVISYQETSAGEMVVGSVMCNCSDNSFNDDWLEIGAGQSVVFSNPLMTEEMLQRIYDMYAGINYHGANMVVKWNESLVSGQFIRIMTSDEYSNYIQMQNALEDATGQDALDLKAELNSVGKTVLISNQTIDFTGDAKSSVVSICPTEAEKSAPVPSPSDAKFRNLYAEMIRADYIDAEKIVARGLETQTAQIKTAIVDNLDVGAINGNVIRNGTVLASALSQEAVQTLSGNHVYYQAEPPTGGVYLEGDTWYKTVIASSDEDKKVLHVWDGEKWNPSDFDAKILRANTITTQEIASNTITANNVNMTNLQTNLARVGALDDKHLELNPNSVDIYDGTSEVASFGESIRLLGGDITISPEVEGSHLCEIELVSNPSNPHKTNVTPDGIDTRSRNGNKWNHTYITPDYWAMYDSTREYDFEPVFTAYVGNGEARFEKLCASQIEQLDGGGYESNTLTIKAPNIVLDGAVNIKQGLNNSPLMRTTHTISNISISAGSYKDGSLNITQSGYYPMAIAGWSSGSTHSAPAYINLSNLASGSATINYRMVETKNTSQSAFTLTVQVLWFKYKSAT